MDNDWIDIALVFSTEPSREEIEQFFLSLCTHPDRTENSQLDIASWDDTADIHRFEGGEEEAAKAFLGYEVSTITVPFERFDLKIGAEYTDWLLSQVPHMTIKAVVYPFRAPSGSETTNEIRESRRRFVNVLGDTANFFNPRWGFGRRGGLAIGEDESIEQLAETTMPPLYEYNVFREETVDALDRDRVTSAPAWYVEELDDGGVFMAVREPPKSCGPNTTECKAVADHLGIPLANPERYR